MLPAQGGAVFSRLRAYAETLTHIETVMGAPQSGAGFRWESEARVPRSWCSCKKRKRLGLSPSLLCKDRTFNSQEQALLSRISTEAHSFPTCKLWSVSLPFSSPITILGKLLFWAVCTPFQCTTTCLIWLQLGQICGTAHSGPFRTGNTLRHHSANFAF